MWLRVHTAGVLTTLHHITAVITTESALSWEVGTCHYRPIRQLPHPVVVPVGGPGASVAADGTAAADLGFGPIVALYNRASTCSQIH
jgi:hypothetical protein